MDTICAISTPQGSGGIVVVRLSGDEAIRIAESLTCPLQDAKGYTLRHTQLHRGEEMLDEVMLSVYRAPHSYTGEDVVEIACHGSLYIQQEVLRWLVEAGCRIALPGEFTRRAFMNGKMDLTQAEAVADLIAAETKAEKDLALSQLKGSVSTELNSLREELLHFTSLVELELDFADHEELEFADRSELHKLAEKIEARLRELIQSFRTGNAIRNGIPVAIVGAPNVGKSTLLNALVGEQRAIVSDIQGTTRDTIEDSLILDGILFRLIDTAGLRKTDDTLENLGIERSRQAVEKAQIILSVTERGKEFAQITVHEGQTLIPIYNKVDLLMPDERMNLIDGLCISAKHGAIDSLKTKLINVAKASMQTNAVMLSNARHYEAIVRAHTAIEAVLSGLNSGLSGELLSLDLQDCLNALGEVTGQITNQEVLSNIFSKFCIGK